MPNLIQYKNIISIQNITVRMIKTDILEQYPHLKSEWVPVTNQFQQKYYKHTYSDDQSEVINLKSVPMKDVDIYSSRESYSFPFCPRIYKYMIQKNYQKGNHLCLDLIVLYQRVSSRLCQNFLLNATNEQIKFLTSKASQIVKGFYYLYRRFGSFQITYRMIGWTQLGIVKVWLNEEYFLNTKSYSNVSQESMITKLITILQQNTMIKNKSFEKCTTFQALLHSLLYPSLKNQSEIAKQVVLKPIQNFNPSLSDLQHYHPLPSRKQFQNQQVKSAKTRKNIIFSYSNKDLNNKSTKDIRACNKKCSLLISQEEQIYLLNRLAQNHLETIVDKTPPSSLKAIHPKEKRTSKKKNSQFVVEDIQVKNYNQNTLQVEKYQENYSKTTVSYSKGNCQFDFKSLINQQSKIRPQILHYSTSTNPISKFLNISIDSNKAYSSNGSTRNDEFTQKPKRQCSKSNLSELSVKYFRQRIQQNSQEFPLKIQEKQQETILRQSQQIQRDLDALFHSDHEFDYNELENELDCIL